MGLLKKAGIVSTTTAGGVAGTVALTHYLSSEGEVRNIADKFRKEHFTLITKQQDWEARLTKYNSQEEKRSQGTRFTDRDITWQELKSICEQAAQEDISESKSPDWKFRRWCVVSKTILNHLASHNLTSLNLDDSNEGDKSSWKKLQKSYLDQGVNSILDLKDKLKQEGDDTWKELQKECKTMSEMDSTDTDFDFTFKTFKLWCTKQEADKLK
ncbi:hypothetical protein HF1_04210 [Mycoplasma haemofelis str. Langford 1]|uniref:Uncharacterized protein n=1 Tax=Mycoplasma haemofelis (strain Langford 1) TaxID=941640 RepID=E8ZH08_MYCHL|nr:hypothetical protein [Mycoplasma haemofelis]CBY92429.1 hypothetical protein HF1_04210 [Mycoplasma haemofelis str. Langford 1]